MTRKLVRQRGISSPSTERATEGSDGDGSEDVENTISHINRS